MIASRPSSARGRSLRRTSRGGDVGGAIAALQDFFDRAGGQGGDPATALAAGTALAALAASFHEAERSANPTANVGDAPLPWLAALHRINRSATADLNLSDRLKTAVRVLADTTGADACGIMLYDETTDTLALRAAVGLNPAAVGVLTLHPGMTITGCAAAEQRVIAAPDARSHPAYASIPATGEDVYASQISVPWSCAAARSRKSWSASSTSSRCNAANSPKTRSPSCKRSPVS